MQAERLFIDEELSVNQSIRLSSVIMSYHTSLFYQNGVGEIQASKTYQ